MHHSGRGTFCFRAVDVDYGTRRSLLKGPWHLYGHHEGDVHSDRISYLPSSSRNTTHARTRYRVVLSIARGHIVQFESTYALTQYMLDALRAHFSATTLARVEHIDISASNIIVPHKSDGSANMGLLIDWEDFPQLEPMYKRVSTPRQFMAAKLCGENPTARTIGDDLESFMLLFLWIAGKYAPTNMSPRDRATFLQHFEHQHAAGKIDLFTSRTTVARLYLVSVPLEDLLVDLLDSYQWRYTVLSRRKLTQTGAIEELEKKQELLESHSLLISTIQKALEDEEWQRNTNPIELLSTSPVRRRICIDEYM